MKAYMVVSLLGAAIFWTGCASKSHSTTAGAKAPRPLAHFTPPEQQQKILEEKIKVKFLALQTLEKQKPLVLQQLTDAVGKENLTNTLKHAEAARAAIQRDSSYLDALKSFYLSLSNRQQAVTAELNDYHGALTNYIVIRATNAVTKK